MEKRYCERIRELREAEGLTQAELATALSGISEGDKKVSREMVNLWEKGARDLRTYQIITICRFFGVTADYLLGLSDVKSANADMQSTCKATGLSESSIYNLQSMKDEKYFEIIENVLSNAENNSLKELLSKIFTTYEKESKMDAFAEAFYEVAGMGKIYFSEEVKGIGKIHFSNDCTDSALLMQILSKVQKQLANGNQDDPLFNLPFREHEKDYNRFYLQVKVMDLIESISFDFDPNGKKREKLKNVYAERLYESYEDIKDCITQIQERREKSKKETTALFKSLFGDFSIKFE